MVLDQVPKRLYKRQNKFAHSYAQMQDKSESSPDTRSIKSRKGRDNFRNHSGIRQANLRACLGMHNTNNNNNNNNNNNKLNTNWIKCRPSLAKAQVGTQHNAESVDCI